VTAANVKETRPFKVIATYSKPEEAHLAASFLEANGIPVQVKDDLVVGAYWFYSNAVGGVKVAVPETDAAAARDLLHSAERNTSALTCPHCGSGRVKRRELSPLAGLAMLIGLVLPIASQHADCADCGRSFTP
jgi:hypothetical protein